MDPVLYDSFDRLLSDISTPQVVRDIEAGGSSQELWQQIIQSGFADAMISEQSGGAGLEMGDAFSLFFLCGRHALPVPLAQTMVARSLCALNGIAIPDGPIALSPLPVSGTADTIECRNVPFGKIAQWVVVPHAGPPDTHRDMLLPVSDAIRTDTGVIGSLQAHLTWKGSPASGVVLDSTLPWLEIAATVTAALMAGAMDAVLNTTVRYAGEREQFG